MAVPGRYCRRGDASRPLIFGLILECESVEAVEHQDTFNKQHPTSSLAPWPVPKVETDDTSL